MIQTAHPNPLNPSTTIPFSLSGAGSIEITIYNVSGRAVRTLVEGELLAGDHSIAWKGRDNTGERLPSGPAN
jgi:flagellar hook assembly protein FlgD